MSLAERSEIAPSTAAASADPSATTVTARPSLTHHTDDGPHTIDDRIILQGLTAAKHLNGMHSHIADVWNEESQRYPVALDLVDQNGAATNITSTAKSFSVKVSNLTSEPALSAAAKLARCGTLASDEEASRLYYGAVERRVFAPPIRNPDVLPTGRNMHALDPSSIPTTAAFEVSQKVVEKLLEKLKEESGVFPESIAFTLWGTDNIKTYGESLAQVLALVGVKPVSDSLGRVNKVELIPLEELGRTRIDVVVSCSGVFRDLFINQMNLLDRGIKMAAC